MNSEVNPSFPELLDYRVSLVVNEAKLRASTGDYDTAIEALIEVKLMELEEAGLVVQFAIPDDTEFAFFYDAEAIRSNVDELWEANGDPRLEALRQLTDEQLNEAAQAVILTADANWECYEKDVQMIVDYAIQSANSPTEENPHDPSN